MRPQGTTLALVEEVSCWLVVKMVATNSSTSGYEPHSQPQALCAGQGIHLPCGVAATEVD